MQLRQRFNIPLWKKDHSIGRTARNYLDCPSKTGYLQVGFVRYIEMKIQRGFIFDRENI